MVTRDNIAQNDPGRFASLLTAKLSRLTTKKREEQLDRDSGMESFQDAIYVSYWLMYHMSVFNGLNWWRWCVVSCVAAYTYL